jgi:hypothetical protein
LDNLHGQSASLAWTTFMVNQQAVVDRERVENRGVQLDDFHLERDSHVI